MSTDGTEELVLEVEHQPSGLGWMPNGSLLIVSMKDQRVLRRDRDGTVAVHAELAAFTDSSVNDMVVDGRGRAWIGCFGFDLMAFADPQLAPTIHPNGTLSDRRVWAQLAPTPELGPLQEMLPQIAVGPDGCTLDAEGHIWAADEAGGRCIRIAAGGAIVDEIRTPEGLGCFACALGGPDGRMLLVCAAPDFLETNRASAREAVLLTTEVDVPHAGWP